MTYRCHLYNEEITEIELPACITESAPALPESALPEPTVKVVPLPAKTRSMKVSSFDYTGMAPAVAKEAELVAKRIRDRIRASIIETGKDLLTIKGKLGHGSFGKWLKFHFGWSERTAQNLMNSAIAFGTTPQIADKLPQATIYKLAAKSTPEEIRQAVIEEIEIGRTPSRKEIEERLSELRAKAREQAGIMDHVLTKSIDGLPAAAAGSERNQKSIAADTPPSAPGATDNGGSASQNNHLREMEDRANKIVNILKKEMGAHFDNIRTAMLIVDFTALQKAFRDV